MRAHPLVDRIRMHDPIVRTGKVTAISQTAILADGPDVELGTICRIVMGEEGGRDLETEVVAIDRDGVTLVPLVGDGAVSLGARVVADRGDATVRVGDGVLGRVVDAFGDPLDGGGPIKAEAQARLQAPVPSPLERRSPSEVFRTGLRAIDGCLTLGIGQRIGVVAPSGAGKTTLISQIVRQAEADVTLLCLVGERGREVEAIWSEIQASSRVAKVTIVAATSDQSAPMRVRAAHYAMALADYWRAQGKHVLFVVDSLTRLAMALREIGLAAGEPPTQRGYTPNVFAEIPRFVERCGALCRGGAITSVMTVLSEGEEMNDPLSEMIKSVLDGHILLSRELAERGHFPAIDMPRSISRQAMDLVNSRHLVAARQVRELITRFEASRTMIEAGLYTPGSSAITDRAIERQEAIARFLRQDRRESFSLEETVVGLEQAAGSAR